MHFAGTHPIKSSPSTLLGQRFSSVFSSKLKPFLALYWARHKQETVGSWFYLQVINGYDLSD